MPEQVSRPQTVREFQQMNAYIYGEANKRYGDAELILRLLEEIAVIMEIARKDELEVMPRHLSRIFSWLCAIANRLGIDLQEALWNKYPGVCPYCLRNENCACAIEHPNIPDKELALRRFRRDRASEPKTLAEHQVLHHKLYYRQNRRIFVIQTAAHIAEEAGEISREFRHKNPAGLQDEMADVVSWIFAVANRCGFELADAAWIQFPYECEKCHHMVCDCECSDPPRNHGDVEREAE